MFDTVLVAGRGLTACRVVRTLHRLGARAVTVHSAPDASALHTTLADESVLLGPADPAASYLDELKVLEAARQAGAQAVHPGSGPLAARASFADAVADAGLTWVGSPVLPAPVPAAPATAAPGLADRDGERRAVWLLVAADGAVTVLTDGVRGPGGTRVSAGADEPIRAAAGRAATEAGVCGLVTVELAGPAAVDVAPWLPHDAAAVEAVTGLDLVELQLRAAAGDAPSSYDVQAAGHGARLVTVCAARPGRVTRWCEPSGPGVRVEAGYREGEQVSPYDDVLATLVVWGPEPLEDRLRAARSEFDIGIEEQERQ